MKELSTFVPKTVKCHKNKNPPITRQMYYSTDALWSTQKKNTFHSIPARDTSIAHTEQRNKVAVFDR